MNVSYLDLEEVTFRNKAAVEWKTYAKPTWQIYSDLEPFVLA
eukprot:CAMPEP_0197060738 /NCGR_PEP_ID=MMETSP1384-20130603/129941_1 /TAXON_ID=29189 /ORGANISM="Ammonia sp." /LENGTH=41 /DNA_ID= /DNA_START= /DNA_END= /DNA_ORIENTATION=